jgi:hypothetical protein
MKSSLSLASMLVVGLMATPSFKVTPVGKERILLTFDENGLTVGQGPR